MTLFLLLVTIACTAPLVTVGVEARSLGIVGTVLGIGVAVAAGVGQFVGHHTLLPMLVVKLKNGWPAGMAVTAYYVAILAIGFVCTMLTLLAARSVAGLNA